MSVRNGPLLARWLTLAWFAPIRVLLLRDWRLIDGSWQAQIVLQSVTHPAILITECWWLGERAVLIVVQSSTNRTALCASCGVGANLSHRPIGLGDTDGQETFYRCQWCSFLWGTKTIA